MSDADGAGPGFSPVISEDELVEHVSSQRHHRYRISAYPGFAIAACWLGVELDASGCDGEVPAAVTFDLFTRRADGTFEPFDSCSVAGSVRAAALRLLGLGGG